MKTYYCEIQHDETKSTWSTFCNTPVAALLQFHKKAQNVEGMGAAMYKITRLWRDGMDYTDDLPKTKNTDLNEEYKKAKAAQTNDFPSFPTQYEGRLSNW